MRKLVVVTAIFFSGLAMPSKMVYYSTNYSLGSVIMKRLCLFLLFLVGSQGVFAQLENAGFDTGDLTGWQTLVEGEADPVSVLRGPFTTDAGTIGPSPDGSYMAFTSQDGPGRSFLYQGFTPEAWQLRDPFKVFFDIAIINNADAYHTPDPMSLDYTDTINLPNQQARIDILKPGASITTVDAADIVVELFQTQPGDPLNQDWRRVTKDVSSEMAAYVGQTLTLRLVQVDNQSFFNLALDNVSVGNYAPYEKAPIPVLPVWLLGLLAGLLGMVGVRRLKA